MSSQAGKWTQIYYEESATYPFLLPKTQTYTCVHLEKSMKIINLKLFKPLDNWTIINIQKKWKDKLIFKL